MKDRIFFAIKCRIIISSREQANAFNKHPSNFRQNVTNPAQLSLSETTAQKYHEEFYEKFHKGNTATFDVDPSSIIAELKSSLSSKNVKETEQYLCKYFNYFEKMPIFSLDSVRTILTKRIELDFELIAVNIFSHLGLDVFSKLVKSLNVVTKKKRNNSQLSTRIERYLVYSINDFTLEKSKVIQVQTQLDNILNYKRESLDLLELLDSSDFEIFPSLEMLKGGDILIPKNSNPLTVANIIAASKKFKQQMSDYKRETLITNSFLKMTKDYRWDNKIIPFCGPDIFRMGNFSKGLLVKILKVYGGAVLDEVKGRSHEDADLIFSSIESIVIVFNNELATEQALEVIKNYPCFNYSVNEYTITVWLNIPNNIKSL